MITESAPTREVELTLAPLPAGPTYSQTAARRIASLDGIRGLAVLVVMLFHFTGILDTQRLGHPLLLRLVGVGWCGVDLFFVLSGFLITGILWDSKHSPRYFPSFYMRRVLRIFPLYYGVLLLVFGLLPLITPPSAHAAWLSAHQPWFWLYGANLLIAFKKVHLATGWCDLDHLWSLAIEEHFYLVWPAVVLVCSRKTLMRVAVGLVAASLLFRMGLYPYLGSRAVYVLTPCRMDALAAGALLALIVRGGTTAREMVRWTRPVMLASVLGLLAIIAARGGLNAHDRVVQWIGYPLSAAACAGLVAEALVCTREDFAGRVLGGKLLGFMGRYSYGLYVYHVLLRPIFARVLAHAGAVGCSYGVCCALYLAISFSASLLIAWLSYHLYEARFLRLKVRFSF